MVVKRPMEPIVQELNRSYLKQRHDDRSLGFPYWHESDTRDGCIGQVECKCSEDDLVIPVHNGSLAVHLLELKTAINDDVLPAGSVVAGQANPHLVEEQPQKQSW